MNERISSGQQKDPFGIISLNLDSLFEDALYDVLKTVDGIQKADIDYCVYTSPLPESPHCPSTKQKAAGLFNIKVLKMHGSVTWLCCPNSNHVYTGLGSPANAYETYLSKRKSPFVADLYPDDREKDSLPILEPYIITPTYSKVFDLPHIQTTWHNAYVELREATKVVFIGYSLPEADYHFRSLLRRAIRADTEIELILYKNDDPNEIDIPNNESASASPLIRYRKLFGRARVDENVSFDGIEAYVDDLLSEDQYGDMLESLKEKLKNHEIYNPNLQARRPS